MIGEQLNKPLAHHPRCAKYSDSKFISHLSNTFELNKSGRGACPAVRRAGQAALPDLFYFLTFKELGGHSLFAGLPRSMCRDPRKTKRAGSLRSRCRTPLREL